VPKERVAEIQKSQHAILEARMSDFQRERDFLKATADQADERISVVEKLRTEEEEGSRADTVELRRLLDLLALQIKIPALELALRSPFGASILRGIEEDTQQRIEVVRQSNGDPSKSIVDDDFVLMPGDVIDVSFRAPKDRTNASR
jgi:Flp pilus assembly CpaE family ATPase